MDADSVSIQIFRRIYTEDKVSICFRSYGNLASHGFSCSYQDRGEIRNKSMPFQANIQRKAEEFYIQRKILKEIKLKLVIRVPICYNYLIELIKVHFMFGAVMMVNAQ